MIFEQKISKVAKRTRHRGFFLSPSFPSRAFVPIFFFLLLFPLCVQAAPAAWLGLWLTPDQQGRLHFERGEFAAAAEAFRDPLWQGAAWYRAGEFEKAAQAFVRRDTAEAYYNQGNSWLMRGQYETAITCYDRALQKRPGWKEAAETAWITWRNTQAPAFQPGPELHTAIIALQRHLFGPAPGAVWQGDELARVFGESLAAVKTHFAHKPAAALPLLNPQKE